MRQLWMQRLWFERLMESCCVLYPYITGMAWQRRFQVYSGVLFWFVTESPDRETKKIGVLIEDGSHHEAHWLLQTIIPNLRTVMR